MTMTTTYYKHVFWKYINEQYTHLDLHALRIKSGSIARAIYYSRPNLPDEVG